MTRKRMIDPSIWTDEGMAELTPRQQLLYIGMFASADDDGRLKGSAAALGLALPTVFLGVTRDEIESDRDAVLATMSRLVRYEVGGAVYLEFQNYRKWQYIQKPTVSKLPPNPVCFPVSVPETSCTTPIPLPETSARIERKGIEEKGTEGNTPLSPPSPVPDAKPEAKPKPKPQPRAHRFPDDWEPSESVIVVAKELHFTEEQMRAELAKFASHFRANGKVMVDWNQAAMNWLRRAPEMSSSLARAPNGRPRSTLPTASDFARMAREAEEAERLEELAHESQ